MNLPDLFDFEPLSMKVIKHGSPECYGHYTSHISCEFFVTVHYDYAKAHSAMLRGNRYIISTTFQMQENPYQDYIESVYWENDKVYLFIKSSHSPISAGPDQFIYIDNSPEELYHEFLRIVSIHRLGNVYTAYEQNQLGVP